MRGDPPKLVLAAVPPEKDEPRAVSRAAVPRGGMIRVEDVVRVVDHVDPPETVRPVVALGPQDRLVQIPRVELDDSDLIEVMERGGGQFLSSQLCNLYRETTAEISKKMAYWATVTKGVLQRISGGFVHEGKRWAAYLVLETRTVRHVLVPELHFTQGQMHKSYVTRTHTEGHDL